MHNNCFILEFEFFIIYLCIQFDFHYKCMLVIVNRKLTINTLTIHQFMEPI